MRTPRSQLACQQALRTSTTASGRAQGGHRKKVVKPRCPCTMALTALPLGKTRLHHAYRSVSVGRCYRYQPISGQDHHASAYWRSGLTQRERDWGVGLCFLSLRNVNGVALGNTSQSIESIGDENAIWRLEYESGCDDKSQSRSPSLLPAIRCGLSTVSTLRCAMADHFGA